jgi:hypothetical protein
MDDANRFIKIAAELFTWGGALPALLRRIGEATEMARSLTLTRWRLLPQANESATFFSRQIKSLIVMKKTDDLVGITDRLREEIVNANVALDRLKVPDW